MAFFYIRDVTTFRSSRSKNALGGVRSTQVRGLKDKDDDRIPTCCQAFVNIVDAVESYEVTAPVALLSCGSLFVHFFFYCFFVEQLRNLLLWKSHAFLFF